MVSRLPPLGSGLGGQTGYSRWERRLPPRGLEWAGGGRTGREGYGGRDWRGNVTPLLFSRAVTQ